MHEREVVIKLRVEADRSATKAATAAMSKATAATNERAKAEKALAAAQKRAEQVEKERSRAMDQYRSSMDKVRGAQTQLAERFNSGLGDMMRFSRGLAMMGLAGEENTEKLLRGLVKVQATVDVIAGSIGVWVRLSNAMRDYASMTQAAAAAHAALQTAHGRSATTGVAAVGGGFLAGAGKLAAGAGGLGLGALGIAGVASTGESLVRGALGYEGQGPIAGTTGGFIGGLARTNLRWGSDDYLERSRRGQVGLTPGLRQMYQAQAEQVASERGLSRAERRRGLMPQLVGLQQQRGQAMAAASALRMQGMGAGGVEGMMGRARGVLSGGSEAGYDVSEIAQAQATLEAGIQRRVQLYEEERRVVQQNAQEKAQAIQQELSGIQRTMAMHEAALERRRSAYQSAAERFALMDPMQQQRALAAAEAVRGGTATAQQAALARGLAGQGSDVARGATRQLEEEARRRGFHGTFGATHETGISAEQRGLETGRAAAAELEKQMQSTMDEARKTGETIGKKMAELLKERDAMMLKAMEDRTDQLYSEISSLQRQMQMQQ